MANLIKDINKYYKILSEKSEQFGFENLRHYLDAKSWSDGFETPDGERFVVPMSIWLYNLKRENLRQKYVDTIRNCTIPKQFKVFI